MHVEHGVLVHSVAIWPRLAELDHIFILSSLLDDFEPKLIILNLVPKEIKVRRSEHFIAFVSP